MKDIETVVSNNIKRILKSYNINQVELSKIAGVSESTVGKWVLEKASPRMGSIQKISDYFDIPKSYILEEEEVENELNRNYTYIPQSISAGTPFNVEGITQADKISIPSALMGKYAGDEDIIITKVFGDSMDKVMGDGSVIAVKPKSIDNLINNDVVVFSNDYEYGVKHYHKYGDKIIFKPNSTNKDHHEQHYSVNDNITIYGKVVMWIVTTD